MASSSRTRLATLAALAAGLLIPTCVAGGRDLPERIRFQSLSAEHGLSQSGVLAMHQDAVGAMWFGTQAGLDRFDGYAVESFRYRAGDPLRLRHSFVFAVTSDAEGNVWVGHMAGLDRIGPDRGQVERLSHRPEDPSTPPPGRACSLLVDSSGRVWVGARRALAVRNSADGTFRHYTPAHGLAEGSVETLYQDPEGFLWLGVGDRTVQRFDPSREEFLTFQLPGQGRRRGFATEVGGITTWRGAVWVASGSFGLHRIDVASGEVHRFGAAEGEPELPTTNTTRISLGADGSLWVGSHAHGLFWLSPDGTRMRNFRHNPRDPASLAQDTVWALTRDRSGILWVATPAGVSRWDPSRAAFGLVRSVPGDPRSLSNNKVMDFAEEADGTLWVATDGGGLNRQDPGTDDFVHYRADPGDPGALPEDSVYSVLVDSKGYLWAGTEGSGLAYRPPGGGGFRLLTADHQDPSTIPGNMVTHLFEDRQGRLLVSAFALGVARLVSHDPPRFERLPTKRGGDPQGLSSTMITALHQDQDGTLWVGSYDVGLDRVDAETGEVTHWAHDPADPDSLSSNALMDITRTTDGALWISTFGGGLNRFDSTTGRAQALTTRDGLPSDLTYRMFEVDGQLWVSTANGLCRVDLESLEVHAYGPHDGLQGREYRSSSGLRARDGSLLFGGNQGFNRFHPRDLGGQATPPGISLDRLRIHQPQGAPRVVAGPRGAIQLAWWETDLEVEFTGYHYAAPDELRYQLRMEGFRPGWQDLGFRRSMGFTNLDPGDYRLTLRAGYPQGPWSEPTAPLRIQVATPPWRTPWAYALYLVLALLGGRWVLARWTRRQQEELAAQRAANQELERLDRLKDAFLATTSHELRTPLHGMTGLAEGLLSDLEDEGGDRAHSLRLIVSSGRRLGALVNDILDYTKLKGHDIRLRRSPVDLATIVDVVLQVTRPLLAGRDLVLEARIPDQLPPVDADEDRLQQVLHNLVGNAVKFTQEGRVTVSARAAGDEVEVTVEDTGVGIPAEAQERIFLSFEQADGSTEREYGGTGLGLAVTRQLVELHGGTIRVTSEPGEGATFTFTLPRSEGQPVPEARRPRRRPRVAEPAAPEERGAPSAAPEGAPRVLVVDDEPVNHEVLKRQLRGGYQLSHAMSGPEALELLETEGPFDLVLLDLMMPRMSGYEVCKRIRSRMARGDLPVIMVTARDRAGDLVEGLDSGANDYLIKPVVRDELAARVRAHVEMHQIHEATGRFLPREFLRLLDRESVLDVRLGDQVQRDMCVLFSDIRSFTDLSEGMSPEQNFAFINEFLRHVSPVIRQHGGFVDKFMGDAVMALFPGTPGDAVDAAVGMRKALAEFNADRAADGLAEVRIGVGIHMGELMLGTIGEEHRMEGTVIADAVNLASRLEGLTKHYGSTVLVSRAVYQRAAEDGGSSSGRFLGRVQVKGKSEPVDIFEVFEGDPEEVAAQKRATHEGFQAGLEAYLARDFAVAVTRFKEVSERFPEDEAARRYLGLAARLVVEGVPEDWSGAERMESK